MAEERGTLNLQPCPEDRVQSESEPIESSFITGLKGVAPNIRQLSRLSVSKGVCALVVDWTVIIGCFSIAITFPHPLVWIAAALIIATRQHALLILMHDAAHYRLLPSHLWNDRLSNWLFAWPLLVTTEGYRHNHLAHHRHLNTDDDPDWMRKDGKPDWIFPKLKREFGLLLIREFFGGGFFEAIRSITDLAGKKLNAAKNKSSNWGRLTYYLIAIAAISIGGLWLPVLLLWFLPAFTILTVILRIRSIAEHFGVEGEHDLNMSRNTHARLWERLLLAPHNSGYHLDHHLYPSVPFYHLRQLHEMLQTVPDYATRSHQSESLLGLERSSMLTEISNNK